MYSNTINLIIGLAIIIIPFMELSAITFTWTLVLAGAIVSISSLWELVVSQDEEVMKTSGQV